MNLLRWLLFIFVVIAGIIFLSDSFADFGPYPANVVRVIDGDTVVVDISLWPDLTQRATIRLAGIDTPELHGPACARPKAEEAKAFLFAFVSPGPVKVIVKDFDKFGGRYDGTVSVAGKDAGQALIDKGLARVYVGGLRLPWC